jgi:hypothetical protein
MSFYQAAQENLDVLLVLLPDLLAGGKLEIADKSANGAGFYSRPVSREITLSKSIATVALKLQKALAAQNKVAALSGIIELVTVIQKELFFKTQADLVKLCQPIMMCIQEIYKIEDQALLVNSENNPLLAQLQQQIGELQIVPESSFKALEDFRRNVMLNGTLFGDDASDEEIVWAILLQTGSISEDQKAQFVERDDRKAKPVFLPGMRSAMVSIHLQYVKQRWDKNHPQQEGCPLKELATGVMTYLNEHRTPSNRLLFALLKPFDVDSEEDQDFSAEEKNSIWQHLLTAPVDTDYLGPAHERLSGPERQLLKDTRFSENSCPANQAALYIINCCGQTFPGPIMQAIGSSISLPTISDGGKPVKFDTLTKLSRGWPNNMEVTTKISEQTAVVSYTHYCFPMALQSAQLGSQEKGMVLFNPRSMQFDVLGEGDVERLRTAPQVPLGSMRTEIQAGFPRAAGPIDEVPARVAVEFTNFHPGIVVLDATHLSSPAPSNLPKSPGAC